DPVYTPARKIHLYHCDHRGLPLALISTEGATAWCAEYDEWGNLLNEENPHQLQQLIRLPGQQYDEESGLYYNRHRYYDPLQGRYITQDPIGLKGGWNLYGYQLNPISDIDPLGLSMWEDAKSGACTNGLCGTLSAMIGPDKFDSIDSTAYDALNKINSQSICEDKEFAGLICKDNSGRYFSTAPNRGERKGSYPFNSPCPKEGANKQVISSQADSLIKISRIWADFFPQTHRISLFRLFFPPFLALFPVFTEISPTDVSFGPPETGWPG
ncbi:RHS repeat-associated core domain-containing protein, partial [Escherichia coli]|uniref:RHS repeat-associated core domain-containing protein n=1 Tax=Escherichia coli TaxID=562 RepID=UPI003D80A844